MKERIQAQEDATIEVEFTVFLATPKEMSWDFFTTTQGLQKWFKELRIKQLSPTGSLEFMLTDNDVIEMPILSYQPTETFGFQWDQNQVLFHLEKTKENQTKVTFIEILTAVNEHSGRDIAGWKMCLAHLSAISEEKPYVFKQQEFDQEAARYQKEVTFLAET